MFSFSRASRSHEGRDGEQIAAGGQKSNGKAKMLVSLQGVVNSEGGEFDELVSISFSHLAQKYREGETN